MKISEEKFNIIFNIFLIVIPSTMIFRKPCSWFVFAFAMFCLVFYKKINFSKKMIYVALIIMSPLLLEILFFWNNNSLRLGLKSMEKSTSLLIFSLFILGNFQRIKFLKIIQWYSFLTTCIMTYFFIRFIVVFPQYIHKYLNGIHLWEMGYVFSDTIGIHAPALNMHLAFVCIICFYLLFYNFRKTHNVFIKAGAILLFLLSFFFVLFVNTRMALFQTIVGFVIVFFYEIVKKYNAKKVILIFSTGFLLLTGIIYWFVQKDPFMIEKYSSKTFAHMDKIGRLDEIEHPEIVVFSSLVTRVSIWKSAWELSIKNLPFGVGSSDGKPELIKYFKKTNQVFLAKYEFPTHNQYLDFLLKFGVLGFLVVVVYMLTIGYIGFKTENSITVFFFFLFLSSNLTDDFLIRFDGIAFSGFWFSVFGSYWFYLKKNEQKN